MKARFIVLFSFIALIWGIFVFEQTAHKDLSPYGILPRHIGGLEGIAFAPLLHGSWNHIESNTFPLAIMSFLIMLHSLRRFFAVTAIVWILGGFLTWCIGREADHIGASGLIFGYFAYIILIGIFDLDFLAIIVGGIAFYFYWYIVFCMLPLASHPEISWEGHMAGFAAGIFAAFVLSKKPKKETAKQPALV